MISRAILATIEYCNTFEYPLTIQEISSRLISHISPSLKQLKRELSVLVKKKVIVQSGKYYHLANKHDLARLRSIREKHSSAQLTKARELALKLGRTPFVLAIYVTGSLAMSNSDTNSDIDFMIITKDNRLWITRFLLTIFAELLGLRRRPHSTTISDKLCLNLYLTPSCYALPESKRSLYTAYELIQALPVYDPHNTHAVLIHANPWILDFLPNVPERTLLKRNAWLQAKQDPAAAGRRVLNGTLNLIELLCFHLQLSYMHRKITNEYITRDSAFFHPNNRSDSALNDVSTKR